MAAHNGTRARLWRLYQTFSALDAPLVSRALGLGLPSVNLALWGLVQTGHVRPVRRTRQTRRPYTRTEYRRAA
ncbi:hypothetical protein Dcar01_03559 [Deinococcus carri]|uniref:Uncharacterized protein n=1 Tax=Deinococcus carri TaxID=1211323 RepID=A0ABP9WBV1_9DEIO